MSAFLRAAKGAISPILRANLVPSRKHRLSAAAFRYAGSINGAAPRVCRGQLHAATAFGAQLVKVDKIAMLPLPRAGLSPGSDPEQK